jgi:hypothetical protein
MLIEIFYRIFKKSSDCYCKVQWDAGFCGEHCCLLLFLIHKSRPGTTVILQARRGALEVFSHLADDRVVSLFCGVFC